jgi:hypothetical protein
MTGFLVRICSWSEAYLSLHMRRYLLYVSLPSSSRPALYPIGQFQQRSCSLQMVLPHLEDRIHFLPGNQAVELQAVLVKIGDKYEDLVQEISVQV